MLRSLCCETWGNELLLLLLTTAAFGLTLCVCFALDALSLLLVCVDSETGGRKWHVPQPQLGAARDWLFVLPRTRHSYLPGKVSDNS